MRATLVWVSVEVVAGVCIVQCHAVIDVVIGVRVMLCHQAIMFNPLFMNFPLLVPILILLSDCINSSSIRLSSSESSTKSSGVSEFPGCSLHPHAAGYPPEDEYESTSFLTFAPLYGCLWALTPERTNHVFIGRHKKLHHDVSGVRRPRSSSGAARKNDLKKCVFSTFHFFASVLARSHTLLKAEFKCTSPQLRDQRHCAQQRLASTKKTLVRMTIVLRCEASSPDEGMHTTVSTLAQSHMRSPEILWTNLG